MKHIIKKILKEETESFDKSILNFLIRRSDVVNMDIGDKDFPIKVRRVNFKIGEEIYAVNSFMSKKEMTYKLLNMLEDNSVVSLGEYNPNVFDKDRQKVVRTIRKFIDEMFK